MEREGSFKLLRNFLGTIAGGLTSLARIPFGKRKKFEDNEVIPDPTAGDETGQDLTKLYPDAELSETRKRATFFAEDAQQQDRGECSKEAKSRCAERVNEEDHPEIFLDLAQIGAHRTLDNLGVTQLGSSSVTENQGVCDVTPETLQLANEALNGRLPCVDEFPVDDEAIGQVLEDSDDNLASFKRILMARKEQQQQGVQVPIKAESPRKRVRFGNFPSSLSGDNQMSHGHHSNEGVGSDNRKRKRGVEVEIKNERKLRALTIRKRKRDVEIEEKNDKKLRALTISDKPVRIQENRAITVGLKRKPEWMDGGPAVTTAVIDEMKVKRTIVVENTSLNANRKAINKQISKYSTLESMQLEPALSFDEKASKKKQRKNTLNSQTADIVYKDKGPANATLGENKKKPHLGKPLRSSSSEGIAFEEKRVKLVSPSDNVMATDAASCQAKQARITRSHKMDVNQPPENVLPSRRDLHAMRQAHGSEHQTPARNDSVEAKRKRVEKGQRGISRSKKIRRT